MIRLLVVGLGGFIGANLRYLLTYEFNGWTFPWGTLTANILGCFGLAFFAIYTTEALPENINPELRLLVTTGFFGALTTFSTFNLEVLNMLDTGKSTTAVIYLAASLIFGLGGGVFGIFLGRIM